MPEIESLVEQLWNRFHREVAISFVGDAGTHPWSVMVEGDIGSYGGTTLADALEHRLEGDPPECALGWGADAT